MLKQCAKLLMREIRVEGYASGLEVSVQVRQQGFFGSVLPTGTCEEPALPPSHLVLDTMTNWLCNAVRAHRGE